MKLSSRRILLLFSIVLAFFSEQNISAHSITNGESGKPTNNAAPSLVAGFRAAYNLSTYPDYHFPSAAYWTATGKAMAAKFNGANAAAIWIVSLYLDQGHTQLGFPTSGRSYPYIAFAPTDYSEEHLNHFDSTGVKVWLQIEPGAANVETLIDLVLDHYGHHPCVVGLGIDIEWYHAHVDNHGRKVTDVEARQWERRVQTFNPAYRLFLKHYAQAWMPPLYRGNILFVDDSQQFYSLPAMISEFRMWGEKFYPNQVAFQFGYPADKPWWCELNDPPATMGKAMLAEIPNAYGLFWVDFTISQIFPATLMAKNALAEKGIPIEKFPEERISDEVEPSFTLVQNHLNPLDQTIEIVIEVPEPSQIRVDVFDARGRHVDVAADRAFETGVHRLPWRATRREKTQPQSNLYYYTMKTTRRTLTKSLMLLP